MNPDDLKYTEQHEWIGAENGVYAVNVRLSMNLRSRRETRVCTQTTRVRENDSCSSQISS
jgi:glycine cleavage system H lipoate-binding protein